METLGRQRPGERADVHALPATGRVDGVARDALVDAIAADAIDAINRRCSTSSSGIRSFTFSILLSQVENFGSISSQNWRSWSFTKYGLHITSVDGQALRELHISLICGSFRLVGRSEY